jgi:hypothetical protein
MALQNIKALSEHEEVEKAIYILAKMIWIYGRGLPENTIPHNPYFSQIAIGLLKAFKKEASRNRVPIADELLLEGKHQ